MYIRRHIIYILYIFNMLNVMHLGISAWFTLDLDLIIRNVNGASIT